MKTWRARNPGVRKTGACSRCGEERESGGTYCRSCERVYHAEYRRSHPAEYAKTIASARLYNRRHAALLKEKAATRRRENPALAREIARIGTATRRAREVAAPGLGVSSKQWQDVLAEYGHRCAYCYSSGPLEMDHIEPLSKGGAHDPSNVAPACFTCNRSKQRNTLLVWLATYGKPLLFAI